MLSISCLSFGSLSAAATEVTAAAANKQIKYNNRIAFLPKLVAGNTVRHECGMFLGCCAHCNGPCQCAVERPINSRRSFDHLSARAIIVAGISEQDDIVRLSRQIPHSII